MNRTWYSRYRNRPEFMANFDSEQEYVDAMFTMIIMFNYGVDVTPKELSLVR